MHVSSLETLQPSLKITMNASHQIQVPCYTRKWTHGVSCDSDEVFGAEEMEQWVNKAPATASARTWVWISRTHLIKLVWGVTCKPSIRRERQVRCWLLTSTGIGHTYTPHTPTLSTMKSCFFLYDIPKNEYVKMKATQLKTVQWYCLKFYPGHL